MKFDTKTVFNLSTLYTYFLEMNENWPSKVITSRWTHKFTFTFFLLSWFAGLFFIFSLSRSTSSRFKAHIILMMLLLIDNKTNTFHNHTRSMLIKLISLFFIFDYVLPFFFLRFFLFPTNSRK